MFKDSFSVKGATAVTGFFENRYFRDGLLTSSSDRVAIFILFVAVGNDVSSLSLLLSSDSSAFLSRHPTLSKMPLFYLPSLHCRRSLVHRIRLSV